MFCEFDNCHKIVTSPRLSQDCLKIVLRSSVNLGPGLCPDQSQNHLVHKSLFWKNIDRMPYSIFYLWNLQDMQKIVYLSTAYVLSTSLLLWYYTDSHSYGWPKTWINYSVMTTLFLQQSSGKLLFYCFYNLFHTSNKTHFSRFIMPT